MIPESRADLRENESPEHQEPVTERDIPTHRHHDGPNRSREREHEDDGDEAAIAKIFRFRERLAALNHPEKIELASMIVFEKKKGMVPFQAAKRFIAALPGVTEKDHFGGDAFHTKRIFATCWKKVGKVNIRVSPELQQDLFTRDGEAFREIENGWGHQGWMSIILEFVERADFEFAIHAAYDYSALKGTAKKKPVARKKAKKKASKKKTKSSRSK